MDEMNARVATVVRSLAGIRGMSTNALATKAGEPTPNFRRYFWTGERPIPLEAVAKVAEALDMSTSELLLRAEVTDPEPFVEARTRDKSAGQGDERPIRVSRARVAGRSAKSSPRTGADVRPGL